MSRRLVLVAGAAIFGLSSLIILIFTWMPRLTEDRFSDGRVDSLDLARASQGEVSTSATPGKQDVPPHAAVEANGTVPQPDSPEDWAIFSLDDWMRLVSKKGIDALPPAIAGGAITWDGARFQEVVAIIEASDNAVHRARCLAHTALSLPELEPTHLSNAIPHWWTVINGQISLQEFIGFKDWSVIVELRHACEYTLLHIPGTLRDFLAAYARV
jgi:hypothetical protein